MLEQIKRLSGLAENAPLQVVLVGQLNLTERLRAPSLRALDERVTIRYRLRPLSATETAAYVRHRLAVASDEPGVTFASGALLSNLPRDRR